MACWFAVGDAVRLLREPFVFTTCATLHEIITFHESATVRGKNSAWTCSAVCRRDDRQFANALANYVFPGSWAPDMRTRAGTDWQ